MRSTLGVVLMLLMANLGFVSGTLPCEKPAHSTMTMAGMTDASPVSGDMADMGHSRDTGSSCATPIAASCCQSLPSSIVEVATASLTAPSAQRSIGPTLAKLTRSVAPETPPPKA